MTVSQYHSESVYISQLFRVASHNGLNNLSADSADDLTPHSPLEEDFSPAGTWNLRGGHGDSYDAGDTSDVSISAAKVSNDGKHPLLEFAMSHFRENNFDIHPHDENVAKAGTNPL